MQFKRDKTELHQMQVMPLRYKIRMTADRIEIKDKKTGRCFR